METHVIELGGKMVVLTTTPFDTDIDVDDLTSIHYHNIVGEILTISVLMNRVGLLLAEVEEVLQGSKLDLEIFSAQKAEEVRRKLTFETKDFKGNPKISKPTGDEVERAIVRDPTYSLKKKRLFRTQKERDYINSLYWAIKQKADLVSKLSDRLKPEEFENEIIEEKINGVLIKIKNKTI